MSDNISAKSHSERNDNDLVPTTLEPEVNLSIHSVTKNIENKPEPKYDQSDFFMGYESTDDTPFQAKMLEKDLFAVSSLDHQLAKENEDTDNKFCDDSQVRDASDDNPPSLRSSISLRNLEENLPETVENLSERSFRMTTLSYPLLTHPSNENFPHWKSETEDIYFTGSTIINYSEEDSKANYKRFGTGSHDNNIIIQENMQDIIPSTLHSFHYEESGQHDHFINAEYSLRSQNGSGIEMSQGDARTKSVSQHSVCPSRVGEFENFLEAASPIHAIKLAHTNSDPRDRIVDLILKNRSSVSVEDIELALNWHENYEEFYGSVSEYLEGYQSIFVVSPIQDQVSLRHLSLQKDSSGNALWEHNFENEPHDSWSKKRSNRSSGSKDHIHADRDQEFGANKSFLLGREGSEETRQKIEYGFEGDSTPASNTGFYSFEKGQGPISDEHVRKAFNTVGSVSTSCIAESFDLAAMETVYRNRGYDVKFDFQVLHVSSSQRFDIFIFPDGCVVWWGMDRVDHWIVDDDFFLTDSILAPHIKHPYLKEDINTLFPLWCTYSLYDHVHELWPNGSENLMNEANISKLLHTYTSLKSFLTNYLTDTGHIDMKVIDKFPPDLKAQIVSNMGSAETNITFDKMIPAMSEDLLHEFAKDFIEKELSEHNSQFLENGPPVKWAVFQKALKVDHYLISSQKLQKRYMMLAISAASMRSAALQYVEHILLRVRNKIFMIPLEPAGILDYFESKRRLIKLEGELRVMQMQATAFDGSPLVIWEVPWLRYYHDAVDEHNSSPMLSASLLSCIDAYFQKVSNIKARLFRLFMLSSDIFLIVLLALDVIFLTLRLVSRTYFHKFK